VETGVIGAKKMPPEWGRRVHGTRECNLYVGSIFDYVQGRNRITRMFRQAVQCPTGTTPCIYRGWRLRRHEKPGSGPGINSLVCVHHSRFKPYSSTHQNPPSACSTMNAHCVGVYSLSCTVLHGNRTGSLRQQHRQLGDIRRDPPGFIPREQVGGIGRWVRPRLILDIIRL
jgi:hypothetical protein